MKKNKPEMWFCSPENMEKIVTLGKEQIEKLKNKNKMKVTSKENKIFKPFTIEIKFENETEVQSLLRLLSAYQIQSDKETIYDENFTMFDILLPIKQEILKQLK